HGTLDGVSRDVIDPSLSSALDDLLLHAQVADAGELVQIVLGEGGIQNNASSLDASGVGVDGPGTNERTVAVGGQGNANKVAGVQDDSHHLGRAVGVEDRVAITIDLIGGKTGVGVVSNDGATANGPLSIGRERVHHQGQLALIKVHPNFISVVK